MKRFAITLVTLFALVAMSVPAEAANNNWDLAKSPSRPSVSSFRVDVGNGNGSNGPVNNGTVNNGAAPNGSRHRHHHHHGGSYGRSSNPYGYYPVIAYPSYGYGSYGGYGGYGYYNSGVPAASFANPTSYGFGPAALFGW